jgi:hypothetical protein
VDAADFRFSSVTTFSFPPHFLFFLWYFKIKVVLAFLLRQLSNQMVKADISGLLGNQYIVAYLRHARIVISKHAPTITQQ